MTFLFFVCVCVSELHPLQDLVLFANRRTLVAFIERETCFGGDYHVFTSFLMDHFRKWRTKMKQTKQIHWSVRCGGEGGGG